MYLFLLVFWRSLQMAALALAAPFERGRSLFGALLVIVALPIFLIWQVLHWIGLLLDEIFFRGYRHVVIREPLFIIGPPRTGTTHLHHVLSTDPGTTTFRTWECLFGLSVTARYLALGAGKLHRRLGSPFARVGSWIGRRLVGPLDDIHPINLEDPEEDFLTLMPLLACFLIVVPLPRARWLWRIARFDADVHGPERRMILRHYRRAIQKHLYVFGADKTFLSKNASFAGMTSSILDEFPDARVIATVRDPKSVVPSQLSSLRPAFDLCGFHEIPAATRDDFLRLLEHYYVSLLRTAGRYPTRIAFIENSELRYSLLASIERAFGSVGLPLSAALRNGINRLADEAGTKVSAHRYTLEEFGLDERKIRSRFASIYTSFDFGRIQPDKVKTSP
jgi:hypothetical protein